MSTAQPRSARRLGFGALSGGLALVGLALVLRAAPRVPTTSITDAVLVLAVLGAYLVAESSQIHVAVRRHTLSISLSDLALVLGLFLLDPWWLLGARLVSAAIVFTATRRSRSKSVFNVCLFATEVGVGVTLVDVLDLGAGTSVQDWAFAYAVVLALNLLLTLIIAGAIAILGGRPSVHDVGAMVASGWLSAVISTTLALMAVVVLDASLAGLVLLGVLVLSAALAHRAYYRLLRRHTDLGQIFAFTQTLGAAQTADQVVTTLLQRARDLLGAETAVLRAPDDLPVAGGTPLVVPRHPRDAVLRRWLVSQGLRDALLVPLHDDGELMGVLQVGNRLAQTGTFGADDLSLLQTLAAHAEVLWRNAHLLERLRHDADHDGLTGLANRTHFRTTLQDHLGPDPQGDTDVAAVLLLDLDRFKEVNDTLGHPVGDKLLRLVAERIQHHVPPTSVVARLGGDEFAILVRRATGSCSAIEVAAAVRLALATPFEVDGTFLEIGVSIGVAMVPADGEDASMLLQHADVAMYAAKRLPTGVARYSADDDLSSVHQLAMAGDLRRGLDTGQVVMHMHPQAGLAGGGLVSFEALARWTHPTRGLIMPDDFIPLAEQTGLITQLTQVALAQALTACHAWQSHRPGVGVAVNLSPRQLLDADLPGSVATLLKLHQVAPHLLTLEITETSLLSDSVAASQALRQLRELGVRLSIDDFGTGYSALAYLQRLPIDELKIDKSFVMAMTTDASARAIVQAIIDLAHTLGLSVVAEGVEDEAARALLVGFGCDVMQGYLLSRPLPPTDVADWLRQRESAVTT